MDPFTQRMLDRAKLRREKLAAKLPAGATPTDRRPLVEPNQEISPAAAPPRTQDTPTTTNPPSRKSSTKKTRRSSSGRNNAVNNDENKPSPRRGPRVISSVEKKVTRRSTGKEVVTSKDSTKISSDIGDGIAVEIKIIHPGDTQVNFEVEEREVHLSDYLKEKETPNIASPSRSPPVEVDKAAMPAIEETKTPEKSGLKGLKKLGALYSAEENLSSPIHTRTELSFNSEKKKSEAFSRQPRDVLESKPVAERRKRLAALAQEINSREDDLTRHDIHVKPKQASEANSKRTTNARRSSIKPTNSIKTEEKKDSLTKPIRKSISKPDLKKIDSPKVEKKINSTPTIGKSPVNTNSFEKKRVSLRKSTSKGEVDSSACNLKPSEVKRNNMFRGAPEKKPANSPVNRPAPARDFSPKVVNSSPKRPPPVVHGGVIPDLDANRENDDEMMEDSPLMGAARKFDPERTKNDDIDAVVSDQPSKKRSSIDSAKVISVLDDVRKIHVAPPPPGGLYPNLNGIDESRPSSCVASLNTSSGSDSAANEKVDKEDWGNTSFGIEMLKVVESKIGDSPKRALNIKRKSVEAKHDTSSSSNGSNNSALDDILDELSDVEYPSPPKQNKSGTVASHSFSYKKGTEVKTAERFKSPLKSPAAKVKVSPEEAKIKPLLHTVSFYRQQQNKISQAKAPVKIIRHHDEKTSSDQVDSQQAKKLIQDSRNRIKELNDEANKQRTIISQASQALNLCVSTIEFNGSREQAEGERLLLLATHRRQALLNEAQRLQVEGLSNKITRKYDVVLKDITLPLRRDYLLHLNADGATGHYFVCLVKCQERVIATSVEKTSPGLSSIIFPDLITLQGLEQDFKITIEVYALQAGKEILPHEVKYHIATKKSGKLATPRKGIKGADLRSPMPITSPGGPGAVRAPSLLSHGYCIFSLNQVSRTSFTLNKAYVGGPVDGSILVKINCEKRHGLICNRPPKFGFLTMFEEIGGFGAWHRRWCVLSGTDLSYWKYPENQTKKKPIGSVDLTASLNETAELAPRDICARAFAFLLDISVDDNDESGGSLTMVGPGRRRYLMAADTKVERDEWVKAFNDVLRDIRDM